MNGDPLRVGGTVQGDLRSEADPFIDEERQRCLRLLLRHPFVTDDHPDPEVFALIRRHDRWLQGWLADQLGFRLVVDTEFARLHKRPAPGGLLRPARSRSGAPFDPRRYTLLCLVLAALERTEVQTVLSTLAREVQVLAASEEGIAPFDLERWSERQAFVDAVRSLVDLGILTLADGDEVAFVEGRGDALYDIAGRRLAQMLAMPVPVSLARDPGALGEEVYPATEEGANRRVRHRLMRRLVEEPVLYLDDLDDTERAYLASQRHYLFGQVATALGLPVEVRREGLAVLDPAGRMTDLLFPATGTVAHAALLLASYLAGRAREVDEPPATVARSELRTEVVQLLERFGRFWSKAYREEPEGTDRLVDDAVERLAQLGLVVVQPEGIMPRPAIARYQVSSEEPAGRGARSLEDGG